MAKISRSQRQNIFKLLIVASLILGGYSIYSLLFTVFGTNYPISREGNNTSQINADLTEINWDYQTYLDELFNSDYFENLTEGEQLAFFEDLLGTDALGFLDDSGLSAEEVLTEYGDELGGVFASLAGGETFDGSMLDSLPPELALAILTRPMFYTYLTNPSDDWDDRSDTLFKIAAYDFFNTTSYDWEVSDTLDNSQSLALEADSTDEKWKIKYPIMASLQASSGLPAVSPFPRVLEGTPDSYPLTSAGVDLKSQLYLGGMQGEASYSEPDIGDFTNLTYNLLYDSNDYPNPNYYRSLGYTMAEYTGANLGVTECMKGPNGETGWINYRNANPFFAAAVAELEATSAFISAGDDIYDKTQAIVDYVGANFVYNPLGTMRPPTDADPIEWLSEVRETAYPFEITSLTVALARLEGLSVRYVSGYKWDDYIASESNTIYADPSEGYDTVYTYIMANMYTYIEVFIPTSVSAGDWVEFDNNFSAVPDQPTQNDLEYILTFDGSFTPNSAGYDRGSVATPTEISIGVSATLNGNPLNAIDVEMKDVSYDTVLDSAYTDINGLVTFTLSLQNMVSGPHILNFSSSYMGVSFGNVSVINVVEDFDIYLTSASPSTVDSSIDPQAMLSIQGYVWDPIVDAPVKNALIVPKGVEEGNFYPVNAIDFIPSAANVSNINGNFSFNISMIGWQQANYTIYSQFEGVFNISTDLILFDPLYQFYLIPYETSYLHGAYTDEDHTSSFVEFLDADFIEYTFTVNNTSSINGANGNYPTGPTIGYRNNLTLEFTATTLWASNFASGDISVVDETEGRTLTSFITNSGDGQGSTTYDVFSDLDSDWTVGPHLIALNWTNASRTAIGRLWVVIIGEVVVDQTSDVFLEGRGGPSRDKYFINSSSSSAYADIFNITGNLRDAGTNEPLQDYAINYRIFDNTWTEISPFLIQLSWLGDLIPDTGGFFADFMFSGSTNVNIGPIHTDSSFTGEWNPWVYGWETSWNNLWDAYYVTNFANDSSTGSFELSDPTDFNFTPHLDNVKFVDTVPIDDRRKGTGTEIQISCELLHESVGLSGTQVYLLNSTTNTTILGPFATDINGYANFTFSFTLSDTEGTYSYKIYLDTGVGTYEGTIDIYYDPNANYYLEGRYNLIAFDVATPADRGVGESFQLSGEFTDSGVGQSGYNVDLIDNGAIIDSALTDSNGYANFTVLFDTSFIAGNHYFELKVTYPGGTYSDTLTVNFDPYLNYTFSPMFDGTLFSAIVVPPTRGIDDILNFSCILTFEGSPKVGETVYLYDVTSGETLISSDVTDGSGYAEILITLNDGIFLGSHDYEIRTDFLTNETTVIFDPELHYGFTARLDDIAFSSTASAETRIEVSGGSVEISLSLLHLSTGQSGATVTLTDMSNGTIIDTGVTDGSGYYNFTVNYGVGVNPGPHYYHISLTYNGGYFTLTGSNYEDYIWVIYNNPTLGCSNIRPDWNEVLGIGDTIQTITVTGTLLDENSLGYNYAELTYWIKQGASVIDPTGIFFVDLSWDTNSQVGSFTALISLIGTIEPDIGNYSIIIGFDGTLDFTDPGLIYNAAILADNATELQFTIFDKPYLTTSYEYDTEGFGFIIGGTNLNISGTLYYSNGTAIAIAGQTITIEFYDENDQLVNSTTVVTDIFGNYVLNDYLMDWDATYFTVSYDGNDSESLDAANTKTEPLIE
nr:transglutaminase domain-containing protein [Candidatus Prometheoarchaeum syntrophicum]QEE16209.1 Transglutaminase-like superfamily protein [Candidatus Prometheoarchaeum syntrophicum]